MLGYVQLLLFQSTPTVKWEPGDNCDIKVYKESKMSVSQIMGKGSNKIVGQVTPSPECVVHSWLSADSSGS